MLGDEGCWRRHAPPHSIGELFGTKALAEGSNCRCCAEGVGPWEDEAVESPGVGEVGEAKRNKGLTSVFAFAVKEEGKVNGSFVESSP